MMKDHSENNTSPTVNSVTIIGTYQPRRCGIATFTSDLVQTLSAQHMQCNVVALNDRPEGYDYPDEVSFEINQEMSADYHTAAKYLTVNRPDMVCLQHEFGIFGGPEGKHILSLLGELSIPVVTTLHTVLTDPTSRQKMIINQLAELSDRLVVMSKSAVHILSTIYDIPKSNISYIPHGIPDMPFVDPNYYKERFSLLGKKVLLTFGLLSESKGIEYVIKGLADIVDQFPDLRYIVLGETHPNVLKSEGEKYRRYLQKLVGDFGLEKHVLFKNEFVSQNKLKAYLGAADIYITPYLNKEQITSGTLAYAAGTGKAVISTPYVYAKEMLADQRGRLVPFRDEKAVGHAIAKLFSDDALRHQVRKRAYDFNRSAIWREVGKQYATVFQHVKAEGNNTSRIYIPPAKEQLPWKAELPELKLDRLLRLTDDTGILQHATYATPNRHHGYCTDDNARALIVVLQAKNMHRLNTGGTRIDALIDRYLAFLLHAYIPETRSFHNFMSYSRRWRKEPGSEDAHGRALWALGTAVSESRKNAHLSLSSRLFIQSLPEARTFSSPRAIAFTLIGIDRYLKVFSGDSNARRARKLLAHRLFKKVTDNAAGDWPWPEDKLTYANARLPHALILTGGSLQHQEMTEWGFQSLHWLMELQTPDGYLSPIGNRGWYSRGGDLARFDQQPIEAHTLLEACIGAYKTSKNRGWLTKAMVCFHWFLGYNDMHQPLYNAQTGGCRDGLQSNGINQNEGAESTLAWLQSLITMQQFFEKDLPPIRPKQPQPLNTN